MIIVLGNPIWELEKQIKDAWRYYRVRSGDCHEIAKRVKARKAKMGTEYAFPEEIAEYDTKARELRDVEEYIAVRQKELNKRDPKRKKEDYKFNSQQLERLRQSL